MAIRRIGILTGGGDVPGLNPCIQAVVRRAAEQGWDVLGFRRGFAGLLHYDPDDAEGSAHCVTTLDGNSVRSIGRTGGTLLHTSRTAPNKLKPEEVPPFLADTFRPDADGFVDCTPHILRVIEALGLDALVAIGGDGTLRYAARLRAEGVKVISIPKTMDNDVFGTDYCIGFSTAVSRSVEFVNALRTTIGSHERIGVIELFGRNSGETALITGYLADVDRVLIAEVPFDLAKVAEMLAHDRAENRSNYAIAVVSEGAMPVGGQLLTHGHDVHGTPKLGGIGEIVGDGIRRHTGINTIVQNLGYLMRSGIPDALDLMVAKGYGAMAVELLAGGRHGLMTAIRDGNYTAVPGDSCAQGKRRVDVESFYDTGSYRPRIRGVQGKPMFLY